MFDNKNNRLILNKLEFKAYLDDSDVSHEMKDQSLPFAPLSFNNDSMMLRVLQKLKLTFNVFSENHKECLQNYKNLLQLIEDIKPSYFQVYDQYVPKFSNVSGYFNVSFNGLPLKQNNVTLHLTSFNYAINKDMGYIEVDIDSEKNKLVPIAYKISIEGKILQQFPETAHVQKAKDPGTYNSNPYGLNQQEATQLFQCLRGKDFNSLTEFQKQQAINVIKGSATPQQKCEAINNYINATQ